MSGGDGPTRGVANAQDDDKAGVGCGGWWWWWRGMGGGALSHAEKDL